MKPQAGMRVRTKELSSTIGMVAPASVLAARHVGIGRITQALPGHGGDVWCVEHEGGVIAVYSVEEMEEAAEVDAPLGIEDARKRFAP